MQKSELKILRGEIVERFINIEYLVDHLITQHYFGIIKIGFVTEVLYDPYFTFGLKLRILEKILGGEKEGIENLRRVNKIRNYFAHTGLILHEYIDKTDLSRGTIEKRPHPEKKDHEINLDDLGIEFEEKAPKVESFLLKTFKDMGGQSYTKAEIEALEKGWSRN